MLTLRALAALLVVAWAPQCGAASLVVGGSAPHAPTTPRTTPRLASPRAAELDVDALGLTPALTKTVKGFQMVPDQKLRYQQLLFLAKKLPPMQPELQVEDNKATASLTPFGRTLISCSVLSMMTLSMMTLSSVFFFHPRPRLPGCLSALHVLETCPIFASPCALSFRPPPHRTRPPRNPPFNNRCPAASRRCMCTQRSTEASSATLARATRS